MIVPLCRCRWLSSPCLATAAGPFPPHAIYRGCNRTNKVSQTVLNWLLCSQYALGAASVGPIRNGGKLSTEFSNLQKTKTVALSLRLPLLWQPRPQNRQVLNEYYSTTTSALAEPPCRPIVDPHHRSETTDKPETSIHHSLKFRL